MKLLQRPGRADRAASAWKVLALPVLMLLGGLALGHLVSSRPTARHLRISAVDPTSSCGPVSLAVVSRWLRAPTSIDRINRLSGVSESGITSFLDLGRAADQLGLASRPIRLDPKAPLAWDLPMILHLHDDHFVPVWPVDADRLIFLNLPNDPVVIHRSDLESTWKGPALVVAPSESELKRALAQAGL